MHLTKQTKLRFTQFLPKNKQGERMLFSIEVLIWHFEVATAILKKLPVGDLNRFFPLLLTLIKTLY